MSVVLMQQQTDCDCRRGLEGPALYTSYADVQPNRPHLHVADICFFGNFIVNGHTCKAVLKAYC